MDQTQQAGEKQTDEVVQTEVVQTEVVNQLHAVEVSAQRRRNKRKRRRRRRRTRRVIKMEIFGSSDEDEAPYDWSNFLSARRLRFGD